MSSEDFKHALPRTDDLLISQTTPLKSQMKQKNADLTMANLSICIYADLKSQRAVMSV